MNIVEAIIKFNGQLIIFISGLSGSGKTSQSEKIAKDLKIKVIHIRDYYKEYKDREIYMSENTDSENDTQDNKFLKINRSIGSEAVDLNTTLDIKLSNNKYVKNQYSTKLIDKNKLNKDIDLYKKNGLIISGFPLPDEIIESTIDFHFHISINQTTYIKYQEKKKNPLNSSDIELKYQQVIKPYYSQIIQNLKINKFLNLNKFNTKQQLYDELWNLIISYIKKWLKKYNPDCSFE